jgi:hypothetical protein
MFVSWTKIGFVGASPTTAHDERTDMVNMTECKEEYEDDVPEGVGSENRDYI